MGERPRTSESPGPVGPEPIPFPRHVTPLWRGESLAASSPTDEVFGAFDTVSRRMDDLARALDCLGFFDDGDDGPRAA